MSQPVLAVADVKVPGKWTFWADLIIGGAALGPIDVAAFKLTSKLSGFGSGSATVNLPCGIDSARLVKLWSWRLWAMYGGQPYWCGVPTGVTDSGVAQVALTLTELPGYLAKRQADWAPTKVYTQVEQVAIAADLAAPLADVGVTVVTAAGAGFKRDRQYDYLSSNRADLLTALSQVIQGPEFRAEYATAAGRPGCTLRIAYPRVGSGAAGLRLLVPGASFAYSAGWDADQLRTHTFAVGDLAQNAAPGTARPVNVVDAPQPDLPRLDAVDNWSGVVLTSTLKERAQAASQQQAVPGLTLTASPSETTPALGTYAVGDDVSVYVVTPLLPDGYLVTGRLTQIDVDAVAGTAAWTIATTIPPPRVRETLTVRLNRIDATQAGMFHSGPTAIVT
jgi:hypothetical protein